MTDDPLGWLDCIPFGGNRSTAEILLCFERTMLCDERLPEDYRQEVRERIWRQFKKHRLELERIRIVEQLTGSRRRKR
jgi:hypothetical protein